MRIWIFDLLYVCAPRVYARGVFRKRGKEMANYGFTASYTEVAKISKNITEWMAVHGDKVNAMQMLLDAQCITGSRAEKYLRIARRLGHKVRKRNGDWYENERKILIP